MSLEIIDGQGGRLGEVSGPDAQGQLGELWTGADAMRLAGVPVQSSLLPALEQVSPDESEAGPAQMRDDFGKFA